jgi:hypothetical protein
MQALRTQAAFLIAADAALYDFYQLNLERPLKNASFGM